MSFSQAAERFGVPKCTIWRKYHGVTSDKLGKPPVLSTQEEKLIVEALKVSASFGYPLDRLDLKLFVQGYLNRKGVLVKAFKNNLPGDEWCMNFERRNQEITRRNSENMKRAKAQLSPETINEYFSNLEDTLANVPPENVLNYDETNISDDPGRQKVFIRKGSKHATRIMDSSKTSNSVMFSAAGDGTLLPPYIVYKAKNLYPEWMEGGPSGTRYNRSLTGWFDNDIFEDWFTTIPFPCMKRKSGKKVLIGDNLSSHLSLNIIKMCQENDISFVFLPANSTHICQPLDVAVFGPLKKAWRKTLTGWKKKNKGVVPKVKFPGLVKETLESMESLVDNVQSGFKSAGIIPLNRHMVLKKLVGARPELKETEQVSWIESFTEIMNDKTTINEASKAKRMKKCDVPPGKSVSLDDFRVEISQQTPSDKETEAVQSVSDSTDNDSEVNNGIYSGVKNGVTEVSELQEVMAPVNCDNLKQNMFVIVSFSYNKNTKKEHKKDFLAKIINCDKRRKVYKVSCLRNHKCRRNTFVFPNVEDISEVPLQQIKCIVSEPVICRGIHTFLGTVL